MGAMFAVLEFAGDYGGFMPERSIFGGKTFRNKFIRSRLPYKSSELSILGIDGLTVTLPITIEDAENDERLKDDVFTGVLEKLRQNGVRAVKTSFDYSYDSILPAASGFYVLPFLLPVFLRKCAKMLNINLSGLEVLILDGIYDLTIDILCIIATEVNHISVYTEDAERLQKAARHFYSDSGLFIDILDKPSDLNANNADLILNASPHEDAFVNRYKKGAVFFDMAGNKKKLSDVSLRRADIISADGIELKSGGFYIDNKLLETVLLADNESFIKYVFSRCGDNDFYNVMDFIEKQDFAITTFLRGGKRVRAIME